MEKKVVCAKRGCIVLLQVSLSTLFPPRSCYSATVCWYQALLGYFAGIFFLFDVPCLSSQSAVFFVCFAPPFPSFPFFSSCSGMAVPPRCLAPCLCSMLVCSIWPLIRVAYATHPSLSTHLIATTANASSTSRVADTTVSSLLLSCPAFRFFLFPASTCSMPICQLFACVCFSPFSSCIIGIAYITMHAPLMYLLAFVVYPSGKNCGLSVCNACSPTKSVIPSLKLFKQSRVCRSCLPIVISELGTPQTPVANGASGGDAADELGPEKSFCIPDKVQANHFALKTDEREVCLDVWVT